MNKKNGNCDFEDYYQKTFDGEWPLIKESLLAPKKYVAWSNPFKSFELSPLPQLKGHDQLCSVGSEERDGALSSVGVEGQYYFLDYASVLVVEALKPVPGEKILDLCSAPGGKALVILGQMQGQGTFIFNERSVDRRHRLQRNLQTFIPDGLLKNITVTGYDAKSWCLHNDPNLRQFDKILLDAPCSSERHVLASPEHLQQWSLGRSKNLAKDQYTMLCSAWQVLRVGGRLVYSTCALSPLENDGVIEKFLAKRGSSVDIIRPNCPVGKESLYGRFILPCHEGGHGPIYFSVLEKKC